jgi:hypothetical protein
VPVLVPLVLLVDLSRRALARIDILTSLAASLDLAPTWVVD